MSSLQRSGEQMVGNIGCSALAFKEGWADGLDQGAALLSYFVDSLSSEVVTYLLHGILEVVVIVGHRYFPGYGSLCCAKYLLYP